jgi:hypothetical protein
LFHILDELVVLLKPIRGNGESGREEGEYTTVPLKGVGDGLHVEVALISVALVPLYK